MKQPTLVAGIVRSLMPFNLLELLAQHPQHGMRLAEAVEQATSGAWSPSPGTLYPMLQRMERDGLLTSHKERSTGAPRRVYSITPTGLTTRSELRQTLLSELRVAKQIVDQHIHALAGTESLSPHTPAEVRDLLQSLAEGDGESRER